MASRSVKALRERYGTSGNKSDRSDAYVLADCLRTDGHRWPSLEPDSPATVTLRSHVRARKDLVENRVAVANQLRAHLRVVFPGAVGLFARHRQPDLAAVPRAVPLRHPRRLALREAPRVLAASQRLLRPQDPHRAPPTVSLDAPAGLLGDEGDARGTVTLAYVAILQALRAQIDELNTRTRRTPRRPPRFPLPAARAIRSLRSLIATSARRRRGRSWLRPPSPSRARCRRRGRGTRWPRPPDRRA